MLLEYLAQYRSKSIVLDTKHESYTKLELYQIIATIRDHIGQATKAIAIECDSNIDIALSLLALDGVVDRILLLPPSVSPARKAQFLNAANIQTTIPALSTLRERKPKTLSRPGHQVAETEWVIPTSGTTGSPKLVVHTFNSLVRTVKKQKAEYGKISWGLTYNLNRFAGLQVFLQSIMSGARLIVPENPTAVAETLNMFVSSECSAISATPSWWRSALMSPKSSKLSLKQITLGGEIVDQQVILALKRVYPNSRVIHVYASTEAGVGFVVYDEEAGFPLSYLTQCPGGIQLKISEHGELLVKNSQPAKGYLEGPRLYDDSLFIATGDLVSVHGSRVFFLGRNSGAINVGGNKVMPEEIEQTILSYPNIHVCQVSALKSSILGCLVQAAVVYDGPESPSLLKQNLKKFCTEHLEKFKVPAKISIVERLALNPSGKLLRT